MAALLFVAEAAEGVEDRTQLHPPLSQAEPVEEVARTLPVGEGP